MALLLETMSLKKAAVLFVLSFLAVAVPILLGFYVAPDPMGHQSNLVRFCDTSGMKDDSVIDSANCRSDREIPSLKQATKTPASSLVMWTQFPHANTGLSMSRWFQFLASSLLIELDDDAPHQYHAGAKLTFEATLLYKDNMNDSWSEMARSLQEWDLNCKKEHKSWQCEQINFFELGSCHHSAYLVNLRLPTYKGKNRQIGTLSDIWITEVHQNGGFTKIMLSLRATFFQLTILLFAFYLHRVYASNTAITLLHKAVGVLGFSLILLNAPVELVSLYKDTPGLLIWSDIRQGAFFAFLILFLIVFMGEHRVDQQGDTSWKKYKYPIFFTAFTSGALLTFDLSERGRQLWDPFHSVWSNDSSRWWGMFFISSALFTLAQDVLYLFYLTFKAIASLRTRINTAEGLTVSQHKHYKSAMWRVVGVSAATIFVAVKTVVLFGIMQFSEAAYKWDEVQTVNLNSASYLGIYAVANVFALNLLLLYSPANVDTSEEEDDVASEKKKLIVNGPTVLQLSASAL